MIKIRIVLFIFTFLAWLLFSWSTDLRHVIVGLIVGLFVAFVTGDIFGEKSPKVFMRPQRYLWFLIYLPVFLWECLKANIDGAYRVLHPDLPIRPGIVKVKTCLKSYSGLTFLANSLTLKPGTMTVDIDRDGGFLYIHWVDVKSQDTDRATELIVRRFENIIKRIFE